jgi:secondary thiamine-phosphate synthase enzyme
MTAWRQAIVRIPAQPRGMHVVTRQLLAAIDLDGIAVGMLHCFVRHTSAGLTINEDVSPDVRSDMAGWFDRAVPDADPTFAHVMEGPDDMAAHIKASLTGSSVTVPVADGHALLGTWQGIYLCEFRDRGGPREVVLTAWGDDGRQG